MSTETRRAGRHFLQIPGPSPVPDRIQRAMARPILDHRGPEFQALSQRILERAKGVFKTKNPVIIFPSSGSGAWEAALVNTMSPGEHVLMVETGQFATLWKTMAEKLGLVPEFIATDWRSGTDANEVEDRLKADMDRKIKAVCIVHNETATGCCSDIQAVRAALDAAGHPALLMVDTISSLAVMDLQHDAWGIDITISGSQKGLMLPPGLSFNAVSDKALAAAKTAKLPKAYWNWADMLANNASGFYPYTPATGLLYGLDVAIDMLNEEGLDNVFARHERLAEATRRAVSAWGLEILCAKAADYSPAVTAVLMPDGFNADQFRKLVLDRFDMSLGTGLGKVAGKVFRIGHLGDTNDLTIIGALSGVEMGLSLAGVPHRQGGVAAAMDFLTGRLASATAKAA
jgi:alanine-glyoxylate transaminase/serine-glyoxylate transaminase/serine-pyruvate transaminase